MATCAQKQAWLAEAETALHTLNLGGQETFISSGPKQIRFAQADAGNLARYVADLRAQVEACTGVCDRSVRRSISLIPRDENGGRCW
jgi:hypothetical protein